MDKKVTIKIKSPSASYQDLEFVCDVTNTVSEVKDRISQEFPTKPNASGQKLVYSGKILKDSDRLENVLRFDEDVTKYTLHLVCAVPQKKTSTENVTDNPFPDGLRQRHNAPGASEVDSNPGGDMDQMMREFSDQYSDAMASMTANPSEAEMAAMQELYGQYMSLYMQYMQSQSLQQQSQVFIRNQQVPVQPAANLPQGPEEAGGGAPGPDGPGGLVMNAGAAAGQIQDVGGDRQRDILDWVYVITRVMLLISVIYFHSSFLRLAFVAGLGFLVYLYQNQNRARQQLRRQQQQQQVEQPQQPPPREEAEGEGEEANNAEEPVVEMEEPAPSKLAVIVTFLTSLVSSIIPEQPQVI